MNTIFRLKVFLVGMAIFWALLLLLKRYYDLEKRGISLNPGFLMWRTDKGLGLIDRISKASKRGWKFYSVLSAVLGILIMVLFFGEWTYGTIKGIHAILTNPETVGVPATLKERAIPIPGVNIPFVVGIIALGITILVHEGAHGIITRRLGLSTKSTGLVLLFVIPGAFVEQEEDEFEEADPWKRIQIASAGPVTNILFALACIGVIFLLINPLPGLYLSDVMADTPAAEAGLQPGDQIVGIGSMKIENYGDFSKFMDKTDPGQNIELRTRNETYRITLTEHPENSSMGYLGVSVTSSYSESALIQPNNLLAVSMYVIIGRPLINPYAYSLSVPWIIVNILNWMFALNLLVGLFNILPLKPLDGGHIGEGIIERFTSRETAQKGIIIVSGIAFTILSMNLFMVFIG